MKSKFNNQKGAAQFLLLLLILAGLGLGVFLVQRQTALKSHASVDTPENSISLVPYYSEELKVSLPQVNPEVNVSQSTAFGVDILVKVNPDAVNTVTAKIKYDPGSMYVDSLKTNIPESFVKNWIETDNNETTGIITLTGGIPNPGYANATPTTAGLFGRIIFRTREGTIGRTTRAELLEDGTALYRNSDSQAITPLIKRSIDVKIGNFYGPKPSTIVSGPVSTTPPSASPSAPGSRVFVTSTTYTGNLGGLAGADQKCQERATTANLGGTWKAWLSDSKQSPSTTFARSNFPYRNLNGAIIADNWTDLTDGTIKTAITVDEFKQTRFPAVWSATNASGGTLATAFNVSDSVGDCWTWSKTAGYGYFGYATYLDSRWTSAGAGQDIICTQSLALYCFEQGGVTPIPSSIPVPSPIPTPVPSPSPTICAQVITPAIYPQTGECKDYPNSCLPAGWTKVAGESCAKVGDLVGNGQFKVGPNFSVVMSKFPNKDGSWPANYTVADINGDKVVNTIDVLLLRSLYVGKGIIKP